MKKNEKKDGGDGQLAAEVDDANPAVKDHGTLEAGYYSKKARLGFGAAPSIA
ncbi:MAG: hypothetical protein WAU81_08570 [Candidatus Aminicenantales bacterium]